MGSQGGLKRQHSNKSAKGKRDTVAMGDEDLTGLDGSLPDYMSIPDDQGARLDDVEGEDGRQEGCPCCSVLQVRSSPSSPVQSFKS